METSSSFDRRIYYQVKCGFFERPFHNTFALSYISYYCPRNNFFIIFAFTDRCTMPLGMEDRRILSGHLRASSSYNHKHGPDRARLNIWAGHGRTGAWVARHRNTHQYLQIDLRQLSIIKGIATQGRREAHQWVKSYTLSYSVKGLRFRPYVAYGRIKVSWYI